ncbi:hypothetical protein NliqN6_0677 [Naganishia liquefaciens]|uniref:Uncharacterized protein n=1 Tax=Naganishia liquefaciens TaxID=104408 RepID=A0A8H3TNE4_9TREE|nr:hypothetical protein NliqN6_0677 [Naganishia liquefaciens]
MATNRAVQDIVNGADPGLATATISPPNDFASQAYDTEVEEYEDLGGVLVLYTRPEVSAVRITYSHTFNIYASWKTDYCAAACTWLFPPRRWTLDDGRDSVHQDHPGEEPVIGDAGNGMSHTKVNGVKQEALMDGIFGNNQSEEASAKLDGEDTTPIKTPFRLRRTPVIGPIQPTYSSVNMNPTFVVLFADHHLSLYFSAMPTFPTSSGTRSNDPALSVSTGAVYPKLDVISCPILTPSVVLNETEGSPETVVGIPAKQENEKPDSSAASSPEQPLLQQQQQQILQQQQQTNIGVLPDTAAVVADAIPLNNVDTSVNAPRKARQIRPGQATIFLREDDETIWVAFRSYRPARIQVPVNTIQLNGMEGRNGTDRSNGSAKSPANAGISTEVLKLLQSMPRQRGPDELSVEALASIGVMRGGTGLTDSLSAVPLDNPIDYANALPSMEALEDSIVNALEGEEEDWICVTELRLDLLSGIPSVSARPIPHINFPYSVYKNWPEQSQLLNFFFLENAQSQSHPIIDHAANDDSDHHLPREGRDLDLVLSFAERNQNSSDYQGSVRLEHIRLSRRELEVSDAFAALAAPDQIEKKPDIKDLSRLEWVATELGQTTLPADTGAVQPGLHDNKGEHVYFSLRNGHVESIVTITLEGEHLRVKDTDIHLEPSHRVLDRSLNSLILVTVSPKGDMLISPNNATGSSTSDSHTALAQAFGLAILNGVAYDDLLRFSENEVRKMSVTSLDSLLSCVWSVIHSLDVNDSPQIKGHIRLVPYLEFATALFRLAMDDRVHTSTLLLHLISTENLFLRSRVEDLTENDDQKGLKRTRSYDAGKFHVSLALSKDSVGSPHFTPAQNAAIDFVLSHPAALRLSQIICSEARGFALSITNNNAPAAPYPGSSQIALTRDAASASLLQSILRDQIEGLGIRISEWQRILNQLAHSQLEQSSGMSAIAW